MARRTSAYKEKNPPSNDFFVAKTVKQAEYYKALKTHKQVICLGPAGTGKTYCAATLAAELYIKQEITKIIVTRPNVSAGNRLGFFPGTLEEKMAPWLIPVMEVLSKHLGAGAIETMVKNGNLEIAPFETMRGRSFENAFVILDEAQNVTPHEIMMFLTRMGEGCTMVLNGDIQQSDLPSESGLLKVMRLALKYDLPVPVIEFTVDDIVRSELTKRWIMAFMKEGLT
jgi:phosphate starvation-inducible PhoH-like protein